MATTDNKDLLIKWLNGAYSLETTLVGMLENQADRASDFPDFQNRIQGHHEDTKRHANVVKGCISRLGGDVSEVRAGISKLFGEAQSQFLGAFGDSIIKDALVGATSEQFEIVSYKAIIALADKIGDDETSRVCKEILKEEEEMLEFFSKNIEEIVDQGLDRGLFLG